MVEAQASPPLHCNRIWIQSKLLGAGPAFTALVQAVVSWRHIKSEALKGDLTAVMGGVRASMSNSGQWQAALQSLSQPVGEKLMTMFP